MSWDSISARPKTLSLAATLSACLMTLALGAQEQSQGQEQANIPIFEPARLYLTEADYEEMDDALMAEYERDPGPEGFLRIMDSLRLHQEAVRLGFIEAYTSKLILEGAAGRHFVHLGEMLAPPWPVDLVAPLMDHFLTSERSALKSWGVEDNILHGDGYLRVQIPEAPRRWVGLLRGMEARLAYPLILIRRPPSVEAPPSFTHPVLSVRVLRRLESYYNVHFVFDDGDEALGYSAICHFEYGRLEVISMEWDRSRPRGD